MKFKTEYFFCSQRLLQNIDEIKEIYTCINNVRWSPELKFQSDNKINLHQQAYNKSFEQEFSKFQWKPQPLLCENPKLKGDFQKNDIFIEIQFGNSSTIYRDYYKFHYGLMKNLLSLAVLIVPTEPKKFFPVRRTDSSASNMAEFDLALNHFRLLLIPVPILLIGLLPEN